MLLQSFFIVSMVVSPAILIINAWTTLPLTTQLSYQYDTRKTMTMTTRTITSISSTDDKDVQNQGKEELTNEDDADDNDGKVNSNNDKNDDDGVFNWLEEWALEGAEKVGLFGIQERTQRVMLAQMTEDRIYEISNILESLIDENTQEISNDDIPKAKELAQQTIFLQKEYKDLVTGSPSTLLDTISNFKPNINK